MDLVEITADDFDVIIDIAYATEHNFTGEPVYARPACYLHSAAAECLIRAIKSAEQLGFQLKLFDAYRPTEAQWKLWNHTPDPNFLAHPERGSPHSRGVAIDLTLVDKKSGEELDMGTPFDDFSVKSHHGNPEISNEAMHNRMVLLGIMTLAGWDFYRNEWWHYQLFDSRNYPLVSDKELPQSMM